MKRIVSGIFAVLMVLCLACGAWASIKVVSPGEDFYYLDTANVLEDSTKGEIYFCNTQLYDACGAQICIAALDTINGASAEDYTLEMATEWGIGSSEKNNGFLLMMAIKEEDYYAIAGSGLQKIFPASVLKQYYDEYLETDFAAKRYDEGARKFFEAVFNKVVDYYNLDLTVEDGVEAYQAYCESNGGTAASSSASNTSAASQSTYGGANGAGGGAAGDRYDGPSDDGFFDDDDDGIGGIIMFFVFAVIFIVAIIIIFIAAPVRRYGRSYRGPFYGPGPRGPHGPFDGPHDGPFGGPRGGGPRGGGGFFGGGSGRSGGGFGGEHSGGGFGGGSHSSFGGGHSGGGGFGGGGHSSFGGGHSGGGGGFGGGAGRGRH